MYIVHGESSYKHMFLRNVFLSHFGRHERLDCRNIAAVRTRRTKHSGGHCNFLRNVWDDVGLFQSRGASFSSKRLSVCKKHSFGAKYFIYARLCSAFLSALYMILLLFLLSPSGVLTAFSQSVGFVLYKENAFYGGLIPECICAVFLALGTAVGIRKHKSTKK